jgi:thermitase
VKIYLKGYLFWALILAGLFAAWQGFNVVYAVSERRSVQNDLSSSYVDGPSSTAGVTESENTGSPALSPAIASGQPASDLQQNNFNQDTPALKYRWTLDNIKALSSARNNNGSSPVLVAVLDTGIDKNHEDLCGKVVAEINFSGSPAAGDIYGHGTPVAGIITANADNGLGITGVAPESRLINVKVANDKGVCQPSALAEGIIWAVDHGAMVINISIELKESVPALKQAVDYAWNKGAIVIAAAGNDGNSVVVYPAGYDNCLAVTAVQGNGALVPLANYGDWVDAAAPGFKIYSTLPGNAYGYKYGTSFAAAYVSGLAAKLFSMVTDANGNGRLNDEVCHAIEAGYPGIGYSG